MTTPGRPGPARRAPIVVAAVVAAVAGLIVGAAGGYLAAETLGDQTPAAAPAPTVTITAEPEPADEPDFFDGLDDGKGGEDLAPPPAGDEAVAPNLPTGEIGEPFTNRSFDVTITDVESGITELRPYGWETFEEDYGEDWADYISYPENGQFIVVYVTAENTGKAPASFSPDMSTLLDIEGREFDASPITDAEGQNFDYQDQQPGTTLDGLIVFDVPADVEAAELYIQSDGYMATENLPTYVPVS